MMTAFQYQQQQSRLVEMQKRTIQDPNRLRYHIMPPSGWMNDPNGLCQARGVNHIYFQYTPHQTEWGPKLWGHYTTKDWIHYQQQKPFLFPDSLLDRDGAYSGSALVVEDKIHYFYTGNVKYTDKNYDYVMDGREQNTIHVISIDGIEAEKKEMILTHEDYPSNMTKHVRDPKVFCCNGSYYMVLGARDQNNCGCALLYQSLNLINWNFVQQIYTPYDFGYQWECPDIFAINGQWFLVLCPQGLEHQEMQNQNVYQCGYFPIYWDKNGIISRLGTFVELDMGFDFYAAQTFCDEKGRRIMIAWMGMPDSEYALDPTVEYDWIHAMTIPRELCEINGKIHQIPLSELKSLRSSTYMTSIHHFGFWCPRYCCYELNIQFDDPQESWILGLGGEEVILSHEKDGCLRLTMGDCGYGRNKRSLKLERISRISVFSDTSSIEIFINGGEYTMTSRVFRSTTEQQISFLLPAHGTICAYELNRCIFTEE